MFAAADVAIRNGVDMSHMKPYQDVRASNAGPMLELARPCLPRLMPLHFVSSTGLAILRASSENRLVRPRECQVNV